MSPEDREREGPGHGCEAEAAAPARRAAIDIGTVSTRLLVADVAGDDVRELVRRTEITHLGEGVSASGRLDPEAVRRTVETVRGYVEEARRLEAGAPLTVATSAARDAEDGDAFLASLRRVGADTRIISGRTEARLAFLGATHSLREERVLVCDLGGGSTELILGSVDEPGDVEDLTSRSIDVGSRRVTDSFFEEDPPDRERIDRAAEWVVSQLRPFFDGLREPPLGMVALGGTATSLSAVHQRLDPYDPDAVHMSELSGADLADLREELCAMTLDERRALAGLDPRRAEVIIGGVVVLEAILGLAGVDRARVSEHDLLYGLVLSADADGDADADADADEEGLS